MTMMKADASPEKHLFLEMFIRDISLDDCVLDLMDNSIDSLISSRDIDVSDALFPFQAEDDCTNDSNGDSGFASIKIDYDGNSFRIVDTCGGISVREAKDEVFRFGHSSEATLGQLGVYGVGLKRAIFKIGNHITIESKTPTEGFRMEINVPEWARDPKWELPFEVIEGTSDPNSAGTIITIVSFREEVANRFRSDFFWKQLHDSIGRTYCLFLNRYVKVTLNSYEVNTNPIPLGSSGAVNVAKDEFMHEEVKVTLYAGLASRDSDGEWRTPDAGWYAACNGRLVVSADKTELTGWGSGRGPIFHPKYRGFIGIAFFYSKNPFLLPWTTTKRGLNQESLVYQEARGRMAVLARPVLRFFDEMYIPKEIVRDPQRLLAEDVKPVDVRLLTRMPQDVFTPKPRPSVEATTSVQYDVKNSELDRIRRHLRKASWPAKKIGMYTFNHFLKTECPE